jgi:hypothetical protein
VSEAWETFEYVLGVMPGLVPGIHVFQTLNEQDVDGREI